MQLVPVSLSLWTILLYKYAGVTTGMPMLSTPGYDVDWSEDYGGLDCMHTLTEPYLSSEVSVPYMPGTDIGIEHRLCRACCR